MSDVHYSSSNIDNKQLLKDYNHCIKEYKRLINAKFELCDAWDPEILLVLTERDVIYEIISELRSRGQSINTAMLSQLDKSWQTWAIRNTEAGYAVATNRAHIPKTKWWWWIDRIGTLSDAERCAL